MRSGKPGLIFLGGISMNIKAAVFEVLSECGEISALGVTSFGEAFVMTDSGGNVLLPSMLYTDPRGAAELEELKEKLGA